MKPKPKPVPFVLGLVALYFVAVGFSNLLEIGSCSTPPSDGLPACPPGSEKYFFYLFGGLVGTIVCVIAGGGAPLFVGIFATIGGSALWKGLQPGSTLPKAFYIPFALGFLSPLVLPVILAPFGLRKQRKVAHLLANGVEAIGTVLSVEDTGVTINSNPRVKLRFRIEPLNGMPPYEASKTATVSRLDVPKVGDRFPVWFDPADPQQWAFGTGMDETASPGVRRLFELAGRVTKPTVPAPGYPAPGADPFASPVSDAYAELQSLNAQRASGKLSDAAFAERTAAVLQRMRTG